jgi:transposase-like protein
VVDMVKIRTLPEQCPYCNNFNTVKAGIRHNKCVEKQMYKCKDCNRKYTPDDGFLRMRKDPTIIMEAVSCHVRGMSLQEVRYTLEGWRGVLIPRKTILMWTRKYGHLFKRWERGLARPKLPKTLPYIRLGMRRLTHRG